MFTEEQIKTAHAKVKSGADFPAYIKEIKALGVKAYEAFVADGHNVYLGQNDFILTLPPKYNPVSIANVTDFETFQSELLSHQQGKTDYLTFIKMCAATGISKWKISIADMTCTYFDSVGNALVIENIPQ